MKLLALWDAAPSLQLMAFFLSSFHFGKLLVPHYAADAVEHFLLCLSDALGSWTALCALSLSLSDQSWRGWHTCSRCKKGISDLTIFVTENVTL